MSLDSRWLPREIEDCSGVTDTLRGLHGLKSPELEKQMREIADLYFTARSATQDALKYASHPVAIIPHRNNLQFRPGEIWELDADGQPYGHEVPHPLDIEGMGYRKAPLNEVTDHKNSLRAHQPVDQKSLLQRILDAWRVR